MKIALTGGIACGKSTFAKFLRELGICLLDADDVVHELEGVGGKAVPAIVARFGKGILAEDGSIERSKLASLVFTTDSGSSVNRGQTTSPCERTALNRGRVVSRRADSSPRADLEAILFPLVRARLLDFVSSPTPNTQYPVPNTQYQAPNTQYPGPNTQHPIPNTQCPTSSPDRVLKVAVIPLLFESHWESDYDIILAITSSEDQQIDRMMHTRGYTRMQAEVRLAAQMPVAEKAARADFVVVNNSTPEHLREEARRLVAWLKERVVYEH